MIKQSFNDNRFVYMRILSDEQINEIIQTAMRVLENTGCKILHKGALKALKKAGAIIEDQIVRVPPLLVQESIRSAPKGFSIFNRLGEPCLDLSGTNVYYGTSTASPNTKDALSGEIHPTKVDDIAIGAKVADALESISWVMPFGSSQDVDPLVADIYEFEAVVTNTTKPMAFCGYSPRGVELVFEMAAEVSGGKDKLKEKPFLMSYPEPISPMEYPEDVVEKMILSADWEIPQITSGAGQIGATSPVTLAGSLVQMLSESFMSLVIAQVRKPGAPVFLAANFGMFDMRTGLNSMASAEGSLLQGAMAEIARFFSLPSWGYAGATDSKCLDAQAGIEAAFNMLAQGLAGVNLIHDVGYMDMGMICSAEMLMMGNEVAGMIKRFLGGINTEKEELAYDIIQKVGAGGNYLQEEHTHRHFKKCWYPQLLTRQSYASWEASGAKDLRTKCHEKVKEIIERHSPEPLGEKIRENLANIRLEGEKEILSSKHN